MIYLFNEPSAAHKLRNLSTAMLRKNETKQLLLVVFSWCFSLGWKSYEGSKSHAKSATSKKWFGFPISKKRELKMS